MNTINVKNDRPALFDEVVAAWLCAEWHYDFYNDARSQENNRIVREPDLANEEENKTRHDLLFSNRHQILDKIPDNTVWHEIFVTEKDIEKIFLISTTWCRQLSDGTLKLLDAAIHFDENQKNVNPVDISKIAEIRESGEVFDKGIIFIAPDINSPWTVIEGNHRMIAFAVEAKNQEIFPLKVFIGISPDMKNSTLYSPAK